MDSCEGHHAQVGAGAMNPGVALLVRAGDVARARAGALAVGRGLAARLVDGQDGRECRTLAGDGRDNADFLLRLQARGHDRGRAGEQHGRGLELQGSRTVNVSGRRARPIRATAQASGARCPTDRSNKVGLPPARLGDRRQHQRVHPQPETEHQPGQRAAACTAPPVHAAQHCRCELRHGGEADQTDADQG